MAGRLGDRSWQLIHWTPNADGAAELQIRWRDWPGRPHRLGAAAMTLPEVLVSAVILGIQPHQPAGTGPPPPRGSEC